MRWGFCVNCLKTDHFNHTPSLAFDRALNILMLRMIGAGVKSGVSEGRCERTGEGWGVMDTQRYRASMLDS